MTFQCAVLITCHDRPHFTIPTVKEVIKQLEAAQWRATVFLVDSSEANATHDGLKDLPDAVLRYQRVGTDVFWAQGMYLAERAALLTTSLDEDGVILWLNDDVALDPDAITRALKAWGQVDQKSTILVGAMRDPRSGTVSFSGKNRHWRSPTRFIDCEPAGSLTPVDTFNGNFVWMSKRRASFLGGIHPDFIHHSADIELGLRNSSRGGKNFLLPETIGASEPNLLTFQSLFAEFRHYRSPLGQGHKVSRNRLLTCLGFGPLQRQIWESINDVRWISQAFLTQLRRVRWYL